MPARTTRQADEDIICIYADGCRDFGVTQAEQYFSGLCRCFDLLAAHPLMARERSELRPAARLHFHKAHVIAYVVEADDVLILRVLSARQDWASYFSD